MAGREEARQAAGELRERLLKRIYEASGAQPEILGTEFPYS
jgi:hypothetical protein